MQCENVVFAGEKSNLDSSLNRLTLYLVKTFLCGHIGDISVNIKLSVRHHLIEHATRKNSSEAMGGHPTQTTMLF